MTNSISRGMIKTARQARPWLGSSAALTTRFLQRQRADSGAFTDRSGQPDIYYTFFGLSGLLAMTGQLDRTPLREYLQSIVPEKLPDLVHLVAYINCCTLLRIPLEKPSLFRRLAQFRTGDGGFANSSKSSSGSLYSCFLALSAYQELDHELPDRHLLLSWVESLKQKNGGYVNLAGSRNPVTSATAAALTIGHYLACQADPASLAWLEQRYQCGGFVAGPAVKLPDLLSTAVAMHALFLHRFDLSSNSGPTLDFIDSLWSGDGGFRASWLDQAIDSEYTFYGLLALGSLDDTRY